VQLGSDTEDLSEHGSRAATDIDVDVDDAAHRLPAADDLKMRSGVP